MKVKYKKLVKHLTGISTPVFGVSWNPPETDREITQKLIAFLEDRRVLYNPYDIENLGFVDQSLIEIRKELTSTLQRIGNNPEISPHIRAMRAACRKYLDEASKRIKSGHHYREVERFALESFATLGELRGIFGIHIAQLAVKYGIDIEPEVASILPLETK